MTQLVPGPIRLHHHAFVTDDQEATRRFYEDVIGMPLVATWAESDVLFGAERTYCHTFFALADGSALAFFQFANPDDQKLFKTDINFTPFRHIALAVDQATQDAMKRRIAEAHYHEPDTFVLDHGYCVRSTSPTRTACSWSSPSITPTWNRSTRSVAARAKEDLARWLAGDHTSNNAYR